MPESLPVLTTKINTMRTYNQLQNKALPDNGEHQSADQITGGVYAPFQWQMGQRNFDPLLEKATLEVRHSWDNGESFTVSRKYVFACTEEWTIQNCYDALLTLSPYQNSVVI